MEAPPKFVWFDGKIVPWEQATVHISTATVLRGANVFEGVRAYWNGDERELFIFRNDEHMARLWNSAKIMRMAIPWTKEELTQAQVDVLRANAFEGTVWFRLTLYVGEGEDHIWPPEQVPVGGFITPRLSPHLPRITEGVDTCISTWTRIADTSVPPRVKAGANYHNSRLAVMEARTNGYAGQPILLNERGKVSEGPGACFCMIRDGALITPPVTANILESITRATVLELARDALKRRRVLLRERVGDHPGQIRGPVRDGDRPARAADPAAPGGLLLGRGRAGAAIPALAPAGLRGSQSGQGAEGGQSAYGGLDPLTPRPGISAARWATNSAPRRKLQASPYTQTRSAMMAPSEW